MTMKKVYCIFSAIVLFITVPVYVSGRETTPLNNDLMYTQGQMKPIDSKLKVKVGQTAPDFLLQAIDGNNVSLSSFRGKNNVVLSFIPAAWTPVCSEQWPGYDITEDLFKKNNAVLLGISVDSVPTLFAWTQQMGKLWFDVLSDFWPHGDVADRYGILRSNGTSERALFFINTEGIITSILVSDINVRPPLEYIVEQLEKF